MVLLKMISFMTDTCKCKKYNKKHPCSSYFKPFAINELRQSCLLRDTWEGGVNLLNELVLGSLNCCVHSSVLNARKIERINNHSVYRLRGRIVCLKIFLFAHAFSFKRY
jgi:hypothetical protein